MTATQKILSDEFILLEKVFSKYYMNIMFNGLPGYFEVREDSTFYEVRDSLFNLRLTSHHIKHPIILNILLY